MSVVVFAYHDVGCMGIRTLGRLGVDVAAVYTYEDDPAEAAWFGSVRGTCEELGIPCFPGSDPHAPEELERIRGLRPDAFFSFYYRDMIREPLLSLPPRGAVNLHGSLLPRYRGRAPVNWMLLHGETRGGATLHHMVKRADAGDIVDQEPFDIGPDDTPADVFARLLPAAERVLERSARAVIDGTAPRIVQMESKATYHGRRRPEDGRIDWRWAAEDVRNLVRAVTRPYPGAFTFAGARKVLIWWAAHEARPPLRPLAPGTVTRSADGVFVTCGDRRLLRLVCVELDGRASDGLELAGVLRDGLVLGDGE